MDMGGSLSELLVLGPSQAASYMIEPEAGADSATMTFDLVGGDSLDNSSKWGKDTAVISLNGVTVATATPGGSGTVFDIPQVDGTTVTATVTVKKKSNLGGNGHWKDSVSSVTITTTGTSSPIALEVKSNANQGIGDEYWGIDNFSASSKGNPGF